jgi:phosphoserine aminotransferase
MKPSQIPSNPCFSSGPTAKFNGWSLEALSGAVLGRSHRAKQGKAKLAAVIEQSREILGIPADYLVGIVPASDTGAVEMSLWSLLGARGVDVLAWEAFGKDWVTDITKQLKLSDVRVFDAPYGQLPDLNAVDTNRDVVFTFNGTTSGVRVPNLDWVKADREGLTICDATSAVFSMEMDWSKLDVVTWSWQKAMGGEGAHGMLVLSPRAVARLESYAPSWPMPKIFRMTKKDKDGSVKVNREIFEGATINTPSMLAVEDALVSLAWMQKRGGLKAMITRSEANLASITRWVEATAWVDFLAEKPDTRSCTSICLKIVDPWFTGLSADAQATVAKSIVSSLEKEGAALDIGAYRDAPVGLRIWGGSTVDTSDIDALLPWLDWAFAEAKNSAAKAA